MGTRVYSSQGYVLRGESYSYVAIVPAIYLGEFHLNCIIALHGDLSNVAGVICVTLRQSGPNIIIRYLLYDVLFDVPPNLNVPHSCSERFTDSGGSVRRH